MKIYSVFRKGSQPGSIPLSIHKTFDSARRFIKQDGTPCFIVERVVRMEYGYSPETIRQEYHPHVEFGRNYYEKKEPYRYKSSTIKD